MRDSERTERENHLYTVLGEETNSVWFYQYPKE